MMRRKTLHAAALSILVLTTVPGFALLCRGHSPSRFATPNLPFWERTVPRPARARVALRCRPLPPGAIQFTDSRLPSRLLNANFNDLFQPLEHPTKKHPDAKGSGRPGQWLITACALGRHDSALRQAQDAAAIRLMNAQDTDGYLAAGVGPGRWSQTQLQACALNLRGLLSYYAVTHSPAAIYAVMRTGDLVMAEFSSVDTDPDGTNSLVLPLTLLYQATGEEQYRQWAADRDDAGMTDGVGQCALYQATGKRTYLQEAQQSWKQDMTRHKPDPELAAALWTLTGGPGYASVLPQGTAPWTCPTMPGSVTTWAHISNGLAVSVYTNSRITVGPLRLTERVATDPRHLKAAAATFTVQAPHPSIFTLRLPVSSSETGQATLNGTALPPTCAGPVLTLTRRWKTGDTVTVPLPPTPPTVSTSHRVGH